MKESQYDGRKKSAIGGKMAEEREYDVACMGAGISGIVASHELAKAGFKVCLLSKKYGGNIGSHKNWFPDDNCEMCKATDHFTCLKENFSWDGVDLYENSSAKKWERSGEEFVLDVDRGYITDGCIKCGLCAEVCPPRAIYLERGWDRIYSLDAGNCDGCGKCVKVCPQDAIKLDGISEEIRAKAIIDARGFTPFDYKGVESYRGEVGKMLSTQEFEDHIDDLDLRGKRIALINCVGCRDEERDYCSSACCMVSIKEAVKAVDRGAEAKIFNMDLRLMGKGYQAYYEKSVRKGVEYQRARIGEIDGDRVIYLNGGEVREERFDYIVLSTAQVVDGFLNAEQSTTAVDCGYFIIGARGFPRDIRDSVISSLAGGAEALSYLGGAKHGEDAKGKGEGGDWEIIMCTCGGTLKAPKIPGAKNVPDLCKNPGILKGRKAIVVACSPSNYGSLFRSIATRCEIVDIRETGYWAGASEDEILNRIEMAGARLAYTDGLLPVLGKTKKGEKFLVVGDTPSGRECCDLLKKSSYSCDLRGVGEISRVEYIPEVKVEFSDTSWDIYDSVFLTSKPILAPVKGGDIDGDVGDVGGKNVIILLDKECSSIRHHYPMALERAIELRGNGANVFLIFGEMCAYGLYEKLYTEARKAGVFFIRSDDISQKEGQIRVRDLNLGEELIIECDLLLEARPLEGRKANSELAEKFSLKLGPEGFCEELDSKFAPMKTKRKNVFVGGFAVGPCNRSEEILQGKAGAIQLINSLHYQETLKVRLNERRCVGCELCVEACPYGARVMDKDKKISQVIEELCTGCGACISVCSNNACSFDDRGMISMIDCALGE